jgi:hypothetical protein
MFLEREGCKSSAVPSKILFLYLFFSEFMDVYKSINEIHLL